jgi:H+-translocating NAD(P) transhydrogenase
MLDMFKRKGDPEEHNYLYAIPALATAGGVIASHYAGLSSIYSMGYLASSLCCIGGITGLSAQSITGILGGVTTALC